MLELKVFQSECADLISKRYGFFSTHPERPRKGSKPRPFFQALSALTGAGKTPILAQAVSQIRGYFGLEPIVLWMSKARSVVSQTHSNFAFGKYSHLVEGFKVISIQNITPPLINDASSALLITTTTGLFNSKEQSEGNLNIYKQDNDLFGDESPWQRLVERQVKGKRRPLLIVYDEGHNLSEQQTELLAELEPDAYLLASATLKLPTNFQKSVIQPIKLWVEEATDEASFVTLFSTDEDGHPDAERFITTAVSSERVVEAQLVKKALQFDGTTAPMESCLDDLFDRLKILEQEIDALQVSVRPKAIYVCKTNITDDGDKDDPSLPFVQRKAPPIRIWRYLVEEKKVPPQDVAIYANLTFASGTKPPEVNLFSHGESDFDTFREGDFRHIIFNLSLQEGWDDPACYLAYIDKSMKSTIQVEQVIGRVLRQPGAQHYDSALLNSAHFFLRVDKESVFTDAIQKVKTKLQSEGAPIEISSTFGTKGSGAEELSPKEVQLPQLHHVFVDSDAARKRIGEILEDFPHFSEGDENTIGNAKTTTQIVELDAPESNGGAVEWKADGHTNPVRLRWLVSSGIKSRSPRALAIADLQAPKFDVRVQLRSKGDKLSDKLAREAVDAFYQFSDLVYESNKPFHFGVIRVPKTAPAFDNALYSRYAGFNKFELSFAKALDEVCSLWHRNSSAGGFFIPLLSEGDTASFYPDFIVWKGGAVYCLDTKGGHLLSDAVARKLFDIKEDGKSKLFNRFITEGKQTELRGKVSKGGYTVWKMKFDSPTPVYTASLHEAVTESLK